MSRFENVDQASGNDRRIPNRLQHIPCGRCYAVIEYYQGAEWSAVSELANEHWKACPGKPHARPLRMAHTPTSPFDTAIVLPPPELPKQRGSSNLATELVSPSDNAWISAGCERKRRTLEQRKLELEQDEYAKNVTTKSVVCGGCCREISLDKRSMYYPGLWLKHRGKCSSIEKLERAKIKTPQVPDGTRPVPCDVVIPAFGGNGYGNVLHLGRVEPHENHSAATTHQLVRHYDSEDPPSEDGEEDGDLLPDKPFPALNNVFYLRERLKNCSDVWAYRYATEDEINTNFFRGQDEPYMRLGTCTRSSTRVSLQTGGHCETSHCVEQAVGHLDSFGSTCELNKPGKEIAPHTLSRHFFAEGCTL